MTFVKLFILFINHYIFQFHPARIRTQQALNAEKMKIDFALHFVIVVVMILEL